MQNKEKVVAMKDEHESKQKVQESAGALIQNRSKKTARKVVRDLDELRRIFEDFDRDESGTIEPGEFLPLLSKLMKLSSKQMDLAEVWKNWNAIDEDGSGHITFTEFQNWYCNTFNIEPLQDFTTFFTEEGLIPEGDLQIRRVAQSLGLDSMSLEKIHSEFMKIDENGNGLIDFDEFKLLVTNQLRQFATKDELDIPPGLIDHFWLDIGPDRQGNVNFEVFAKWYMKFFGRDDFSPMELYYSMCGAGRLCRPSLRPSARLSADK